jgi:hypothetical protein
MSHRFQIGRRFLLYRLLGPPWASGGEDYRERSRIMEGVDMGATNQSVFQVASVFPANC